MTTYQASRNCSKRFYWKEPSISTYRRRMRLGYVVKYLLGRFVSILEAVSSIGAAEASLRGKATDHLRLFEAKGQRHD